MSSDVGGMRAGWCVCCEGESSRVRASAAPVLSALEWQAVHVAAAAAPDAARLAALLRDARASLRVALRAPSPAALPPVALGVVVIRALREAVAGAGAPADAHAALLVEVGMHFLSTFARLAVAFKVLVDEDATALALTVLASARCPANVLKVRSVPTAPRLGVESRRSLQASLELLARLVSHKAVVIPECEQIVSVVLRVIVAHARDPGVESRGLRLLKRLAQCSAAVRRRTGAAALRRRSH